MDESRRIQEAVDEFLRRRNANESITVEDFVAQYPSHLQSELREQLRRAQLIFDIEQSYTQRGGRPGSGAPHSAPPLGDFRLLKFIAGGGYGGVWLARNAHVGGSSLAIKVVHKSLASTDVNGVGQYKKLVKGHPNLISIDHVGETADYLYYSMPRADNAAESDDLADYEAMTLQWCCERSTLTFGEIIQAANSVLSGLEHLHKRGLAHWDVKPSNIVRVGGTWQVADMGLVTPSNRESADRGTYGFRPPEMEIHRRPTKGQTADLFATGKTLDLLVTKHQLNGSVDPRAKRFRKIIVRACENDPSRRYRSAREMRKDIEALLPKKRWTGWAVAALFFFLGVSALFAFWQPWQPSESKRESLKGYIDLWVTQKGNPLRQRLMLHQQGALPLRPGDEFEYQIDITPPAYLYVVYLDSAGVATPLFPWKNRDWNQRPAEERRPGLFQKGVLDAGRSGIESLLLLVREDPLPAHENLEALFAGLPKQHGLAHPRARALFVNGELVRHDPDRGPPVLIGERDPREDPVQQTQALLRDKLRPLFPYTRAVCFAFQGNP